jgi:hypothetical protein
MIPISRRRRRAAKTPGPCAAVPANRAGRMTVDLVTVDLVTVDLVTVDLVTVDLVTVDPMVGRLRPAASADRSIRWAVVLRRLRAMGSDPAFRMTIPKWLN